MQTSNPLHVMTRAYAVDAWEDVDGDLQLVLALGNGAVPIVEDCPVNLLAPAVSRPGVW